MHLGDKLKALRKAAGATQKEVAALLSIHASNYSKVESGAREPSVRMLSVLADHFGVTIDEIISGTHAPTRPLPPEPRTADAATVERARLIESLPEDDQAAIFRMVDALVSRHKLRSYLEDAVGALTGPSQSFTLTVGGVRPAAVAHQPVRRRVGR